LPFMYGSSIGSVELDVVEIDSAMKDNNFFVGEKYYTTPGGALSLNRIYQYPYGPGWHKLADLVFVADQVYAEDLEILIDTCQYVPGNSVVLSRDSYNDPTVPIFVGLAGDYDVDGDGVSHFEDNCPITYNPNQLDGDGDGVGDACDICLTGDDNVDTDADGFPNVCDNCPTLANTDQADTDGDGFGDLCDPCPGFTDSTDTDADGIPDDCDNCLAVANADQADIDNDGAGDACDDCVDVDGDGYGATGYANQTCPTDNCPNLYNTDQSDTDGDGVGNACDNCIITANPDQANSDSDSHGDACDNCPYVANEDQADSTGNGIGDRCDGLEDMCGNVNGDYATEADISDLVALVEYLYINPGITIVLGNADMDDYVGVTHNDLQVFVDHIFYSLDPLQCNPTLTGPFPTSTADAIEIRNRVIPAHTSTWETEIWLDASESWTGLALPVLYDCSNSSAVLDSVVFDTSGMNIGINDEFAEFRGDTSVLIGIIRSYPVDPGTRRVATFYFSNTYSAEEHIVSLDTCTIEPSNTTVLSKDDGHDPVLPHIVGLASESDLDGDGILDMDDNCPLTANPDQYDSDTDGLGDGCDNCPFLINIDQEDTDGDGVGDLCDACPDDPLNDPDGDGICGGVDNCPDVANAGQDDTDGDGVGDACDICEGYDDADDGDGDLVPDGCDNCAYVSNPDQSDGDDDGYGDLCDLCPAGDDSCATVCTMAGDFNFNWELDQTDLTDLIDYIYLAGPAPPNPLNADCDNHIGIGTRDVMYLQASISGLGVGLYCPPVEPSLPEIDSNIMLQFRETVEPYATGLEVPLTLVSPTEVLAFNFPLKIRINDTIIPTIDSLAVSDVFNGLDWEFTPDVVFRTDGSSGTALVSGVTFWGDTPLAVGSNRLGTLYLTIHPSSAERVLSMSWGIIKPEQPMTLEYPDVGLYPVVISPGDLPESGELPDMAEPLALATFLPEYGPVVTATTTCCVGPTVGDADCSNGIDVSDIQVMIDHMFLSLAELCCEDEGDIDFNSEIDISDLQLLIDNQFLTLTPLPACP